jgi:hypothetical protein
MFFDRYKELCDCVLMTPNSVGKILGISSGSITAWKKNEITPKTNTVQKIATHFNVPVSFLLESQPFDNWELKEKYSTEILVTLNKTIDYLEELIRESNVSLDGKPLNNFVMLLDTVVRSIDIDETKDKITITNFYGNTITENISELGKELITEPTQEQKNKPVSEEDRLREENNELFSQLPNEKKQQALDYLRYLVDHQEKE